MTLPPDVEARRLATRTFDRNVVVVAGAGSGKTTLLVERLLNLTLGVGMPLTQVVALTFTEKAASEMRARLAAQLARVLDLLDGQPRGEDPASFSLAHVLPPEGLGVDPSLVRERALQALHDLDAASIGTIHAACADLLRRHPEAARLDPAFVVDDGSRAELVLDEEWIAFQARTLRAESAEAADWRVVLSTPGASAAWVRDVAKELLDHAIDGAPADVVPEIVARARELLARCEEIASWKLAERCETWRRTIVARLAFILAQGPAALRAHEADHAPEWPTQKVPAAGKACQDAPAAEALLKDARAFTDAIAACDEPLCDALLRLASSLAGSARARLEREGVVGFADLLVRARDVLRDDLASRRAAQSHVRALLLDEFQDTDPLQYEIAFLLAEDPARPLKQGGDPWQVRLSPGRLFIVGDPKQSIYRFRGADISAYARAVGVMTAQGALRLELVANFRSRPSVLAPVNDLCGALLREDAPYQPRYDALAAVRASDDSFAPSVQLWSVRGAGKAEAWRLAEARTIAARVRTWHDGELDGDFGRVVILLRAMTAGEPYQRALAEAGIPFVTQGGKSFFARPEIVEAVTLLRCLTSPSGGAALLAMLRSAWCAADDAEILRFARLSDRAWTLRALDRVSPEDRASIPRVARAIDGLRELAARIAELPADEAVRVALLGERSDGWRPRLLEVHAASRDGAQRIANLEKLVDRAESLARDEGLSLARIVARLEKEVGDTAAKGESPLADESVNAVRIMTIHQAKGLEFDVVVLPDLAHQKSHAPETFLARDGRIGLRLGSARNLAHVVLSDENARHEEGEAVRLLYVALTRAKERLVLVNGAAKANASALALTQVVAGWSYDPAHPGGGPSLHEGVAHAAFDAPGEGGDDGERPLSKEEIAGADELARALLAQRDAAIAMAAARRPKLQSPSGMKEQRERELLDPDDEPKTAGLDRSVARAVGVAVHLALEAGLLDDGGVEDLVPLARRAAAITAVEAEADPAIVASQAESIVRGFAASPIARELRGCRVLARELPFLLRAHAGADWQGFVDLVVERAGETWVVDWKTDREVAPERHRAQLDVYAEAVRRWRGLAKPPRRALAYVVSGDWVEA